MKKILLLSILCGLVFTSCKDDWDDHYNDNGYDMPSLNDSKTELIDMSLHEFFEANQEYSSCYDALNSVDSIKAVMERPQALTLWVVDNYDFEANPIGATRMDTITTMMYHINHLSYGYDDLKKGTQVRTLGGVYINVTRNEFMREELNEKGEIVEILDSEVYLNFDESLLLTENSKVVKTYRLNDGNIVHVMTRLLTSRISIYEYIQALSDDYSMIRDSILSKDIKVFRPDKSKIVGVDKTGNTIYDSVFDNSNTLFGSGSTDFSDKSKSFTFLLPTNNAIDGCLTLAEEYYGYNSVEFTDTVKNFIFDWVIRALLYSGQNTFNESNIGTDKLVQSAYGSKYKWKMDIQQADFSAPLIKLNNGIVYEVNKIKVPNYVILEELAYYWPNSADRDPYRIPTQLGYLCGELHLWELLPEAQRENGGAAGLYIGKPMLFGYGPNSHRNFIRAYNFLNQNPMHGWPADLENPVHGGKGGVWPGPEYELSIEFPPLIVVDEGGTKVSKIRYFPVGEYDAFFSCDGQASRSRGSVFFNGQLMIEKSNFWIHDEPDRKPGTVGRVEIVNKPGDPEGMGTFRMKWMRTTEDWLTSNRISLQGWALKPTQNNY